MTHINSVINQNVAAWLTQKMQAEVLESDPSYVNVLRIGLLQKDTNKGNGVNVVCQIGDPEDKSWIGTVVNYRNSTPYGLRSPLRGSNAWEAFEIGGGGLYVRRFSIYLSCFFLGQELERAAAETAAHVVLGRAENWLLYANTNNDAGLLGLVDEWNETVVQIIVASSYMREGGGVKKHIHRGRIQYEVMTSREW